MAQKFFVGLGVLTLALSFSLTLAPPSNAQSDCIGTCLEAYIACMNSSGVTPNCDDQYDNCVEGCLNNPSMLFSDFSEPAKDRTDGIRVSTDELLQAHGGRLAISAVTSYGIEMVKLVSHPRRVFAQSVRLYVQGDQFKRETSDSYAGPRRVEIIDDTGNYEAVAVGQLEADSERRRRLPADFQRPSAVRTNVALCSLLPFLKALAHTASTASYLGRDLQGTDRYGVATSGGQFVVALNQDGLISRVEMGQKTLVFADFKNVGALRLPFVESVAVGKQQVFTFFFSEFALNPTFSYEFFRP